MVPFVFGSSDLPLFGLYHPATHAATGRGVVIVNPLGPEYLPAYPVLRALAVRLAQSGLHVLRFDFSGSGDSAGASGEGTLEGWVAELELAVDELRAMAGVQDIAVVGLRLGATIAARAEQRTGHFSQVVLWEPVMQGSDYLAELREQHEDFLAHMVRYPREATRRGPPFEVMGYPIGPELERSLAGVDLTGGIRSGVPCLTIAREAPKRQCLVEGCRHVEYTGPSVWLKDLTVEDPPIPTATIEEIVGYVRDA